MAPRLTRDEEIDLLDPMDTATDGFPLDQDDVIEPQEQGAPMMDDVEDDDEPEDMDPELYQNTISAAIDAAENYIDTDVSPDRELGAKYYLAEPFGNEETGRSSVVSPEVRGAVLAHMPAMMRTFAGTERFIEFTANAGTPHEQAEAQTDYVSYVIMNDSNGYVNTQSAIDDALRRKTGVFTWWWEEKEMVTHTEFSGLNEDAFALLQLEAGDKSDADEGIEYEIELTSEEPDELQDGGTMVPEILADASPEDKAMAQAQGAGAPEMMVYGGILRRRIIRKRAKWRAVPPEEFIITPTTSADLDTYELIGTREEKSIGELVALGYDEELIREAIGADGGNAGTTSLSKNPERMGRNNNAEMERIFDTGFEDVDPASTKVKFCVVYVLIDKDGDGIIERRKIATVGDLNRIIYDEIYDDDMVPFGLICPYPEPHSPFGLSVADLVMDTQEVKSEVIRGTLDSLAESISTRLAFWQGKVNVDDILNTRRGAAIRTTDIPSNVIQDIAAPFVGQNTMPIIAYLDTDRNTRTGTNPATPSGFDPDSIQSTSREAVGSMVDASQERSEYIARNFAETGFKRLYKGMRNLLLRHQDHRRVIRLNGEDVAFDPRSWLADLDVEVLVGTGRSNTTKKIMALEKILAQQSAIYEKYGPNNPVVTLEQISYTSQLLIRAYGYSDPSRFVGKVTPEIEKNLRDMAAKAAQKPTPEQLLAEVQKFKITTDAQVKMAAIRAGMEKAVLSDDQRRDAEEMRHAVAVAKILGDYGIQINEAEVRQKMADDAAASEMAGTAIADNTPAPAPTGGNPNG